MCRIENLKNMLIMISQPSMDIFTEKKRSVHLTTICSLLWSPMAQLRLLRPVESHFWILHSSSLLRIFELTNHAVPRARFNSCIVYYRISPLLWSPTVQLSRLLALRSRSPIPLCFIPKPSLKMILTFIIVHLKWLSMNARNSTFSGLFASIEWNSIWVRWVTQIRLVL